MVSSRQSTCSVDFSARDHWKTKHEQATNKEETTERKKEKGGKEKREREHRGLVRSASPTAGWAVGYTRKRSVVLGPAVRRGWLGGETVGSFEVGRYRV